MTRTVQLAIPFETLLFIRQLAQENTDEARQLIAEIEAQYARPMTSAEETEAADFEAAEARRILETGYIEQRKPEYPPIGDQLDALMKWLATETEFSIPSELKSLAMKCMSVKARYPKPVIQDE